MLTLVDAPHYDLGAPYLATITLMDNESVLPIVLFQDSFEVSEWNNLWLDAPDDDWSRDTTQTADGSFSAVVRGPANDGTLTTADPVDLTPYTLVEIMCQAVKN